MDNQSRTRNRGFASMDSHRQREIARKGGRAAHEKGKAHEFTPDEARAAGRKGGEKVSVNRSHMAEIGRRGGRSSAARRRPDNNSHDEMKVAEASSQDVAAHHAPGEERHNPREGGDASTAAIREADEVRTPASENL